MCARKKSHPKENKPNILPTSSASEGRLPAGATDPEPGSPPNTSDRSDAPPLEAPLLETPVVQGPLTGKVSTTTTLASSGNPSPVGETVAYTATLSAIAATGTVKFTDNGTTITGCAAQTVGFGHATCAATSYAMASSHSITATYSGDGNYLTSTASTLTQTISSGQAGGATAGKNATTTMVSSSLNPSVVGEAVTYTATVSPATATGTVVFKQAGVTITGCSAQAVSTGTATCTVTGLAAGGYWITAAYSGDSNYSSSSFPGLTQTVKKKTTTTTMSSSLNPSVVGEAVTYTATVSPATATGTVAFKQAGETITSCSAQTVTTGTATCTVTGLGAGQYGITAAYSGDNNYNSSWSPGLTQTVKKKTTTTTMSSSLNPSTVGEAITYTASVSPATATGTVVFKQAGETIPSCSAQTVTTGTATCTVTGLGAGGYWITAAYSGDSNYSSSSFSGLTQTVKKKTTTTTMSSSLNPTTVGEAITYTASVSPATATGTVAFKQAGTTITSCSAQTVTTGTATCTVTGLAAGQYGITAAYSGDNNYNSSSFPGLTQTVKKKTTTTTMSSSLNPSVVGEAVTYTATVSPATATGTVVFKQAGETIPSCSAQTVTTGTATCTVTRLGAGGYWITAAYSGDSNYSSSSFPGLTQTVKKKTTTTTISSSLNPSTVGEAITYTATVSPATATGTVAFKQAGETITSCSAQTVTTGTATCTVTGLGAGQYGITAAYSGDNNYNSSWSPGLTQTVKKKTTTTTVASSSNPSVVGEAVTYTATVSPATATGTIEFAQEGVPITGCTAKTISSGMAMCAVTGYPSWSSYKLTAAYGGDGSDLPSSSPVFTQTVEPPAKPAGPFRFFSSSSFWNEELPTNAPLDPTSAAVVGAFDEDIANEEDGKGPFINTTSWSVPVYTVPADQPMVKVTLWDPSRAPGGNALQTAWDAVPLPPNAKPSVGSDANLVVWQPSTDRLWEFWRLEQTAEGWQATWGGAVQNVSSDSGAYGPEAWPGAEQMWGASASSLSIVGGLITLEDLKLGRINHALELAVPNPRAAVYASPALRTDGSSTEPFSLPEGAHLRLDPSLDLGALHLPRFTLMMAEAAQRYGIVVRDTAGDIAFYGQDPTPTGTNPYIGAHGYYEGKTAQQLLATFPWSHLQLLKMELHSTS